MDQDFTPIILKKRPTKTQNVLQKQLVTKPMVNKSTNINIPARKIDDEAVKLPTSNSIKLDIQQKRAQLGISQEQLDIRCSLPKGTTKAYESGKAIVKTEQLEKIKKVLNLNIRKPKAQKLEAQS